MDVRESQVQGDAQEPLAPVPELPAKSWMQLTGMGMTTPGGIPHFLGLGPNSTHDQDEQTQRGPLS
jgi:hypothetical protein